MRLQTYPFNMCGVFHDYLFMSHSPAVTVDGETHYGEVTMNEFMDVANGNLYVCGIPTEMGYDGDEIIAPDSNVGGISNIRVNDV